MQSRQPYTDWAVYCKAEKIEATMRWKYFLNKQKIGLSSYIWTVFFRKNHVLLWNRPATFSRLRKPFRLGRLQALRDQVCCVCHPKRTLRPSPCLGWWAINSKSKGCGWSRWKWRIPSWHRVTAFTLTAHQKQAKSPLRWKLTEFDLRYRAWS